MLQFFDLFYKKFLNFKIRKNMKAIIGFLLIILCLSTVGFSQEDPFQTNFEETFLTVTGNSFVLQTNYKYKYIAGQSFEKTFSSIEIELVLENNPFKIHDDKTVSFFGNVNYSLEGENYILIKESESIIKVQLKTVKEIQSDENGVYGLIYTTNGTEMFRIGLDQNRINLFTLEDSGFILGYRKKK